ncbi:MAG: cell division protein FtsQ/DivIB [Cytophagaceae bacterium]
MKFNMPFFKKSILLIVFSVSIFSFIGFSDHTYSGKTCQKVIFHIDYQYDNYFVNEEDVMDLMTLEGREPIEGIAYDKIDLKKLESRILAHKFVKDAQVYKDVKGNLMVEVQQDRPVARIIQTHGPHAYVSNEGGTLPFSPKFTARVILVDGDYIYTLLKPDFFRSDEGMPYLEVLNIIDSDKFWKAQLAQMTISANGEITFTPQVGDEVIEFGLPEQLEEKFKKMKIYYKEILPMKGFQVYSRVKLKYKDQIICE